MAVDFFGRFARSKREFDDALAGHQAGKWPRRAPIRLGAASEALRLAGVPAVGVVLLPRTLDKIIHDKHHLPYEMIKQVPAALHRPVMIFQSTTEGLVVMTDLQHNGKTCVAALHPNQSHGVQQVNEIKSIHPRESETHFLNWWQQGLCRYQDTKKSQRWSASSQAIIAQGVGQTYQVDSGNTLPDQTQLVNTPPDHLLKDPQSPLLYSQQRVSQASQTEIGSLVEKLREPVFQRREPSQPRKGFSP
ncbi:MAG: hypothetical protein SFY92_00630 [Verrucomicrobiae bacterium]|nr:hypothetical protein [Verrucomicrobiae bacterium]